MSFLRRFRRSEKLDKKALKQALEIISSIQKLIEFKALYFDRKRREVWLVREIFWDQKDDNWKANFCKNLKMYVDINWDEVNRGKNLNPIDIFSIDLDTKQKKDYIISYFPDTGKIESKR